MEEPKRIGLTKEANGYLEEMLESLNSDNSAQTLIKFDLYRLAVALGVKRGEKPTMINGTTDNALRVSEIDEDNALYVAVKAANLQDPGESVYRVVERLAEQGVRNFYDEHQKHVGKLPWDKILV